MPPGLQQNLLKLSKQADILAPIGGMVVLAMLVVPLPPLALDLLLLVNIAAAVVVLLNAMYAPRPLAFSIFPALLLAMTLFRLSLNVAAARLILTRALGGHVIEAFGSFVIGGNYVVGMVVFLILIVIQFAVVTSGAGRVAEVAARFTLDAMPGKQLSIDADLSAGLINEAEARRRRKEVEQEADFYGAMDGASKFVRGDAIAAIVIVLIDIIGGFIVGVAQHGMTLTEALQRYTLLTVGEGLVTQIPALIISTATGFIVTRAASESNLGEDVALQVFSNPRVLGLSALVVAAFALVPGVPKLAVAFIAASVGVAAWMLRPAKEESLPAPSEGEASEAPPAPPPPAEIETSELLRVDAVSLEIGYGLVPLVDAAQGGDLLERVKLIRRQIALQLGFIMPPVRVRDSMRLKPNGYLLKVRGVEVASGEVFQDKLLAIAPTPEQLNLEGFKTKDPAFGVDAVWIDEGQKLVAEAAGCTVVNPSSVIATHLSEIVKQYASRLFGRKECKELLDALKETNPIVVDEVIPGLLSLGQVHKVLQYLLEEKVPIRDLVTILETLGDYAAYEKNLQQLGEACRRALAPQICSDLANEAGELVVIAIEYPLELRLREEIRQQNEVEDAPSVGVELWQRFMDALANEISRVAAQGYAPILVCADELRPFLRNLLLPVFKELALLARSEISDQYKLKIVGVVRLSDEDQAISSRVDGRGSGAYSQ